MIHLDLHDPRPMYEQVVDQMEMLAVRGVLEADSKLPSVRQMAMELSLNPNTVQKAYSELLSRGVIYSVRGKGNFVSSDCSRIRQEKLEEIRSAIGRLLEQARELGATTQQRNELLRSFMEVEQV
ncbi:GntR family transcriptional regulator [Butyricicoccus porcorum]|uniref:GntR family transcriptional regulator n=1 Tax=Butyricicoccus porcorum TaxID=1945634 RepID=A0A252F2M1_9FIRM|nr:GntR family transcriptional regulator [Butyricicoccus porcorum]MDY4484331.1 GntR family transcriptional regulator [Butyricicoccus porcorum]OUM20034.1 GntR family transcriptional regulator [Butyricicoccus porcorum]